MQSWLKHLSETKSRSERIAELARLARTDQATAQRELRRIDQTPVVFGGAEDLEAAVRWAIRELRRNK